MKSRFKLLALSFIAMLSMMVTVNAEVVQVGTWEDLKNCLIASEEQTCQLKNDITTGTSGQFDAFMRNVSKKTLDVQGYTLKLPVAIYTNSPLDITGTSNGKIVAPDSGASLVLMAMEGGTVKVSNVTLEGSSSTEGQVVAVAGRNNKLTIAKTATLKGNYGILLGDSFD